MVRIIIRMTALAALPLAAFAAPPVAPPASGAHADFFQHMLQKMDRDGDGRISLDEYLAEASARFKSIDSANRGRVDAADIASSPGAIARIDRHAARMVRRLDGGAAGYVSVDEFVAAAQKRFARLDRSGDGRLTPDELVARRRRDAATPAGNAAGESAAQRFDKIDANHDGVVTPDEYSQAARRLYAELDTRHDGRVTADEIAGSARAQQRALRFADRMVRHLDSDGDGSVSQDEYVAAARTRFMRLDKNGDGFIDASEATAGRWAGKSRRDRA